jgi:spore germination protein GerM
VTRWGWVAAAVIGSFVVASCGIADDTGPRDVPAAAQRDLGVNTDFGGGETTGTARIYLLAPTASGHSSTLQPVARDVQEQPTSLLQSLFAGPNSRELSRQFHTAIPPGTTLLSSRLQGNTLTVDVSKELLQLSGDDLVDALAQIVFTAAELDAVHSVKILVAGAEQQWPAGNGEVQTAPLTIYDYPGRVASAQPAYPAIPTPNQP